MGSYETYILRSAGLSKIFCNFRNNPMVLLFLLNTFIKCSSNVNLLSNVNPKCFAMMPEKYGYCRNVKGNDKLSLAF